MAATNRVSSNESLTRSCIRARSTKSEWSRSAAGMLLACFSSQRSVDRAPIYGREQRRVGLGDGARSGEVAAREQEIDQQLAGLDAALAEPSGILQQAQCLIDPVASIQVRGEQVSVDAFVR
jgi:hypothetical protein